MTLAAGPPTIVGEVTVPDPPTVCDLVPLLEDDPPDEELVDDSLLLLPPPLEVGGTNGLGSPYRLDCRRTGNATALPTRAKSIKQNAISDFFILFLVLQGSRSTQHQRGSRIMGISAMRSGAVQIRHRRDTCPVFSKKKRSALRASAARHDDRDGRICLSARCGQHGGTRQSTGRRRQPLPKS